VQSPVQSRHTPRRIGADRRAQHNTCTSRQQRCDAAAVKKAACIAAAAVARQASAITVEPTTPATATAHRSAPPATWRRATNETLLRSYAAVDDYRDYTDFALFHDSTNHQTAYSTQCTTGDDDMFHTTTDYDRPDTTSGQFRAYSLHQDDFCLYNKGTDDYLFSSVILSI
jgi:hypothetical protein